MVESVCAWLIHSNPGKIFIPTPLGVVVNEGLEVIPEVLTEVISEVISEGLTFP